MTTAQQLEFESVEHVDYVFSILVDGWTLVWWGAMLIVLASAWWFARRKRSAREADGS